MIQTVTMVRTIGIMCGFNGMNGEEVSIELPIDAKIVSFNYNPNHAMPYGGKYYITYLTNSENDKVINTFYIGGNKIDITGEYIGTTLGYQGELVSLIRK